jgi:GT2 family glycosyltransferase/glycosyltransferase involved in cell wall biosynthesis
MDDLERLEEFRQHVVAGVRAYEAKLAADFAAYRKQRAWRLMLAARKAYALARRGGWRGRWRALVWAARGAFGGPLDLEAEDLYFPEVVDFMPEQLFRPVPDASATAWSGADPEGRHDVLVLPPFDYDFRYQRPQQIAAEFARRGHRVFWLSPTHVVGETAKEPCEVVPLQWNMWEVRIRMRPPDLFGGELDRHDLGAMLEGLERWQRESSVATAVSLVQFPYWRQCALALRERFGMRVVYDCMDDWQNWTHRPGISPFSLGEEQSLFRECDLLLVSSQEFEQRRRADGLSPVLVRNGTDFEFFRACSPSGLLDNIPQPVIGYYGAIAEWFDLPLLEEVARARPQYSFVLIGHNYRSDIHRLRALPNVFLLGEKRYRQLPSYLRSFRVCLIPFALSPLTRGVDPVKVYEYFSQGKPVVATSLPELKIHEGLIHFAEGPAEFAAKIDAALAEADPGIEERRVQAASRNTWAHRADVISEAVRSKYPLVSILIVTSDSQEFLRPCLDSVRRMTQHPNYEVVIVDSHSSDGTPEIIRQYANADRRIHAHFLAENRGFAGASNEAARQCRGEFLLLLNADTIVTSGWLHRLMRILETDSTAGVATPVTNLSANETKIDFSYWDLATLEEFAKALATRRAGERSEIAVAPLFCAMVSRRLWLSLGGLDERFQAGMFGDDDFSLRVRKAGFRILVAEDCLIHRFGGGFFAELPRPESTTAFEENRRLFEEKWGQQWSPHRLRPGVTPPLEDRTFNPAAFVASTAPGHR